MEAVSPWFEASDLVFTEGNLSTLHKKSAGTYIFEVHHTQDSLWITAKQKGGGFVGFRAAFAAGADVKLGHVEENEEGAKIRLTAGIGKLEVRIQVFEDQWPILRYTTTLIPSRPLLFPFWPRDIFIPHAEKASGKVHVQQIGARSGLLYMEVKKPKLGSLLYMQNLTALTDYCEQTQTSSAEVVGGEWPELGFSLPVTKEHPLAEGKPVIISDAFVAFDPLIPRNESKRAEQFMDLLAAVYIKMPRPETTYKDWPDILEKGLKDLTKSTSCWTHTHGQSYFNGYVSDYKTPPESMVQLAVLLPIVEYNEWSGRDLDVVDVIQKNLPTFYSKKIGSIVRWLPAVEDQLEEEEEQKKPGVMDSWYLHHPLLNLSRLALKGNKQAEKLFLDSLEYAIKVAHHFDYQWPVFYKMDTLEVIKKETMPGRGGEHDVPGTYAQILLQAYELTGKKRYLQEAEKAVQYLKGHGFDLLYQANNTAFSAKTLLRLWKMTRKKTYLNLSYICLANLFKNMQLWDCQYGYGKHFANFFAVFPLRDAPYTAVYEEEEVFTSFHDYLELAEGEPILPSVRLLLSEFIRYMVDRACFYYPPLLPQEMLEEKPKVGELDPKLWIALEDLHDGWEKSGSVGQEVYGAGNAFGILPRHYKSLKGESFMIYADNAVADFFYEKGKPVTFKVLGDERVPCKMRIIPTSKAKLPECTVEIRESQRVEGVKTKEGHLEFEIPGGVEVRVEW